MILDIESWPDTLDIPSDKHFSPKNLELVAFAPAFTKGAKKNEWTSRKFVIAGSKADLQRYKSGLMNPRDAKPITEFVVPAGYIPVDKAKSFAKSNNLTLKKRRS